MSYILRKVGNATNIAVNQYEADTELDIKDINVQEAPMGSRCYVIESGNTYVLNGSKEWRSNLNGSILSSPSIISKGSIVNLDLDGNGDKQYRVLKCNGNVCKVLGMWDDFTSKYNETSATTDFNGTTAQKYEGSTLDTYLNTTWYNTLSSEAKNAIVPENVVQYCYKYYDEPNTPNTPTYTYQYQFNWSNLDYNNADNIGNVTVGERNVFALDLKDIFDYFEKVCITSDELMTMFWNSTTAVSKYLWLRSSYAVLSDSAWGVEGYGGLLNGFGVAGSRVVRPALNLDMSKIQYTLV